MDRANLNYVCVTLFLLINWTIPVKSVKRSETLDSDGKFNISWEVSHSGKEITFEVKVETNGYIGFGISASGGMKGADIVIGGVAKNGIPYFKDRYAEANGMPIIDTHQDWKLLRFYENGSITFLEFSRPISSCDPQDVSITKDAQKFIWAIGKEDYIKYHEPNNRGSYIVNILDPPTPEIDLSRLQSFDAVMNLTLPPTETTYWCTVHRSPPFTKKQHVIAFGPKLLTPEAHKHSHHLSFYKCTAPNDVNPDSFFEPYITAGGRDCFAGITGSAQRKLDIFQYCMTTVYSWAMGARKMFMPEGVGFPIGTNGKEYYLLEIHLNNPGAHPNISLETGIEIHYTPDLKPIEAAIMSIGGPSDWRLVIPPSSSNFVVGGHCSSACTSLLDPAGHTIFNVQLHAHSSARTMRLRQFRNGTELPWITDEQMYDNSFQNNRNIEPVKFMRGDHITLECGYDNTWVNPPVSTIGGFSTSEEMCASVIYYYPKAQIDICSSDNVPLRLMSLLGIQRLSSIYEEGNPTIVAPASMKGKAFKEYLDTMVKWTDFLRYDLQDELRAGPHYGYCSSEDMDEETMAELALKNISSVTYPEIDKAYTPFDECHVDPTAGSIRVKYDIKLGLAMILTVSLIAKCTSDEFLI